MKITIDKNDYELNFGIGFLRELDKVAGMESNGVSMGMGLIKTIPAFEAFDPLALFNIIYCGTAGSTPRPSLELVEDYFDTLKDSDIEKLFTEAGTELKKSPMVRFTINRLNK